MDFIIYEPLMNLTGFQQVDASASVVSLLTAMSLPTSILDPGGVKENSQGSQTPGTARDQPRPPEWGRIAQPSTDDTVIHDSCSGWTASRMVKLGSLTLKCRFIPKGVRFATEEGSAKKGVPLQTLSYTTSSGVAGLFPA